mmetsp:Transcript_11644/g.8498  ORF Transcript_11644/g.8498 Transcript_11644/m.8498 type:complete len:84 (+) Transcript_11644:38-289(+)
MNDFLDKLEHQIMFTEEEQKGDVIHHSNSGIINYNMHSSSQLSQGDEDRKSQSSSSEKKKKNIKTWKQGVLNTFDKLFVYSTA